MLSPLILLLLVANQVNDVPGILEVSGVLTLSLLQISSAFVFVMVGLGRTNTLTVCGKPLQPLKEGVTV